MKKKIETETGFSSEESSSNIASAEDVTPDPFPGLSNRDCFPQPTKPHFRESKNNTSYLNFEIVHEILNNPYYGFLGVEPVCGANGEIEDFVVLMTNRCVQHYFETAADQILNQPLSNLLGDLFKPDMAHFGSLIKVLRDEDKFDLDCNLEAAQGNLWCRLVAFRVGKGIALILSDISQRKEMQERLHQSENRLRAVLNDQTDFVCRFRSDQTIIYVNPAWCKHLGKREESLVGQPFQLDLVDKEFTAVWDQIRQLKDETKFLQLEHQVRAPNGSIS